jgi:hypothetical protein
LYVSVPVQVGVYQFSLPVQVIAVTNEPGGPGVAVPNAGTVLLTTEVVHW